MTGLNYKSPVGSSGSCIVKVVGAVVMVVCPPTSKMSRLTLYILYISVICSTLIDPELFLSKSWKGSQHLHSPPSIICILPGI